METTVNVSLLDVKEAAKRCGYAQRTLRKYAQEGHVEAQTVRGPWGFPEQEIGRLSEWELVHA